MENDFIHVHSSSRASSTAPFRAPGPMITPSASPPIQRSFISTSIDDPSPTKKRRLSSSIPLLPGPSNADTLAEIDAARRASSMKVLEIWSQLAEKYTRRLDEDDIINLRDETIIKDRGVLSSSGSATWQIGSFADGQHESRGASVQEEEDFDEIDAFYSPSRYYSPSELEDNDVGHDSELKRQSKRIPPVRERDPEDAEDLREFLKAERLRKEMFDEADGEESTDMDEIDAAELIENSIEDIEEQNSLSEIDLVDVAPSVPLYATSNSRREDSIGISSTDDLPLCYYDTSNPEEKEMSDDDEFGSWAHDEASAIYEPSSSKNNARRTPIYAPQTLATPPSSTDYPRTPCTKVLPLKKFSKTSLATARRKTPTPIKSYANELTPNSHRMNEKFEELQLNSGKYSHSVHEERQPIPAIPYQTPPWSSPSLQAARPISKISLIDLTNDTLDEDDILADSDDNLSEHKSKTLNSTLKNNNSSRSASKVASHQPNTSTFNRGSSLKPEVVIVQRSWNRLPGHDHIPMVKKGSQELISSRNDKGKRNVSLDSGIDYLSPSPSTSPTPQSQDSSSFCKKTQKNQKKMIDLISRKRRRTPSPELYDLTQFDNQDLLYQAESTKSADSVASHSPDYEIPESRPYGYFEKTSTLDDRVSSRSGSHKMSHSFLHDSRPSSPIPRFGYSVPPSANATNFGREDISKISHDMNTQYALIQAINNLSYLMRNNPQILPSVPGTLPGSHQNVPWMINANTFSYPLLAHQAHIALDPHTNYEMYNYTSQDPRRSISAPSSPTGQYNMRGRSKSRGMSPDIRRPKSAMRNASRLRRTQRRSVSFTNPEAVSVDGEVYTPIRLLERTLINPENREISNSLPNRCEFTEHEQIVYEENLRSTEQVFSRMRQRKCVRAQTPGPSDQGKVGSLSSGIARYSEDTSFKSNASIRQASGKKGSKGT